MIFDFFSSDKMEGSEFVPDEILTEAMQLIVPTLDLQISSAREMSHTMPDGEERFNALLSGSFFYGYVFGFSERIGMDQFSGLIAKQNFGENIRRLIQGVVANLLYPETEPNWDAVLAWEAQAVAYGTSQNENYNEGMKTGTLTC